MIGTALVILLALSFVQGRGPPEDVIKSIPGLKGVPPFKQYSGYLKAGGSRLLHYWFTESQGSPDTDPVILWMNGGPGCSSLLGLITELGPFHLTKDGRNLTINPYSWNKVANVIFLEAPAGVGFSYDPDGDYHTNDDRTADDNYLAVQDFFTKFPSLRNNGFYVMGESYGGVYVPMLTSRLLKEPRGIKLKGYAIGNGYLDGELLGNALIFFGYYHGLYGLSLWHNLTESCCTGGGVSEHTCNFNNNVSPACQAAVSEAAFVFRGEGLNIYNLYDPCEDDHARRRPPVPSRMSKSHHLMMKTLNLPVENEFLLTPPCIDDETVISYYNREDVKKALHVENSPLRWTTCSDVLHYEMQYNSMKDVVKELVDSGRLKTLIYNGDVDMACNFLGDEWFVNTLGYTPTSKYKIWKHGKQVAGFFQTYKGNLTFVTVKGSGHMVPQNKPAQALHMISNFLNDAPF